LKVKSRASKGAVVLSGLGSGTMAAFVNTIVNLLVLSEAEGECFDYLSVLFTVSRRTLFAS
jgi:hypothetical protein